MLTVVHFFFYKDEETEKKRYREETVTLNKLQHKCANARAALLTTKQQYVTSENKLIQATDRFEETTSLLRIKSLECESLNNQTTTIRSKGSSNINKKRSSTYADVKKLVDSEQILNATQMEYQTMTSAIQLKKKKMESMRAHLSDTTRARQTSQTKHEANVKVHCETQACALVKKSFEGMGEGGG